MRLRGIELYDELKRYCIDSPERPDFHPELTLMSHIAIVMSKAVKTGDRDLLYAAAIHDLFKPLVHGGEMKKAPCGTWYVSNPDHPKLAAEWIDREDDVKHWLWFVGADWRVVKTICLYHMEMKHLDKMNRKTIWNLGRKAVELSGNGDIWNKLIAFRSCDDMVDRW